MERDLDEMLVSQEKMLARLNKPSAPRAAIERAFREHLRKVRAWLAEQPNIEVLFVSYNDLLERPAGRGRACQRVPRGQGRRGEHVKDSGPIALQEPKDPDRSLQRTGRRWHGLTETKPVVVKRNSEGHKNRIDSTDSGQLLLHFVRGCRTAIPLPAGPLIRPNDCFRGLIA